MHVEGGILNRPARPLLQKPCSLLAVFPASHEAPEGVCHV